MTKLIIKDDLKEFLKENKTSILLGMERQHYIFKFPNDYGASVIKGYGSYGYEDDLFELALIKFYDSEDYDLFYDETGTFEGCVVGYLTNERINELLKEIKERN